jgi:hypothetical protein
MGALFGGGPQIKMPDPAPPAPPPPTPATVQTPAAADASVAVQMRQYQNHLTAVRNRLTIPVSGTTAGSGVAIPT